MMPHRIQALREYRREYFHALRNGMSSEQASDKAFERVKAKVNLELAGEHIDALTRQERWADILEVLIEWQIMLKDIPIDKSRIPEKPIPADRLLPEKDTLEDGMEP